MTKPIDDDARAGATSAAPSALGYLAQVEYGLLLTLERLSTEVDFDVSMETADDIVFHEPDSSAIDLLQAKHRVDYLASLSDYDSDFWKTIYNWIKGGFTDRTLILITNGEAKEGSAASLLRPDHDRDVERALTKLQAIARSAGNKDHTSYYKAFLELDVDEQRRFLANVSVADRVASVDELDERLRLAVRLSVQPRYRDALLERLRGWWAKRTVVHLRRIAQGEADRITASETEAQLFAISRQLRDDDLPIDYSDLPPMPSFEEVAADDRVFVRQLQLIALGSERLRQCIYDHNRAFYQRSRWQREELLNVGELDEYDERLLDEWRRHFTPLTDNTTAEDEEAAIREAQERFAKLDSSSLPRIRSHVEAQYVANGSLHILADRGRLGWHPNWIEWLREILGDLGDDQKASA